MLRSPRCFSRAADQVAGDLRLDRRRCLFGRERLGEHELALRSLQVALLDERRERVLEDGLAHGLAPFDLASEEHLLADAKRASHELFRGLRALLKDARGARGDAIALDEVSDRRRIEREPP